MKTVKFHQANIAITLLVTEDGKTVNTEQHSTAIFLLTDAELSDLKARVEQLVTDRQEALDGAGDSSN